MPKPIALDKPCEVCGKNEWWDNTTTKKNPKHPDFKCANKECKTESGYPNARWLPKGSKPAPSAPVAGGVPNPQGGRLTPDDTTPDEQGRNVPSWEALTYTYGVLTQKVVNAMLKAGMGGTDKNPQLVDPTAVQAGVATLLIQGEKAHIPLLHPRKVTKEDVQKPEPKKAKPPVDEDEWERVDADRSELPF